tara:strand:+ start:296 stop:853 length:558 start_codon:yes stop_codon:yes gene_type:complete
MHKWTTVKNAKECVGKSGVITLCTSPTYNDGQICVRKQFAKDKSIKALLKEIECQSAAAQVGVAPKVVDFCDRVSNSEGMYIVMEKCDGTTLNELMCNQNGLYEAQLLLIERLYERLGSAGVAHNDANLANVMANGNGFSLIDYGMASMGSNANQTSFRLLKTRIEREIMAIHTQSRTSTIRPKD